MSAMLHGFYVGISLLAGTLPIIVITICVAAVLSWIFGPRSNPSDGQASQLKWYKVYEYSRVLAIVSALSAFGSFQGYLIGSVGFEGADKMIASLISGAITFLSTIVALLYAKDAPESFKRSVAPGIIGFFMCFLIFKGYEQALTYEPLPEPSAIEEG